MTGLFLIGLLVSQNLWAKTYGGTEDDRAHTVIQTSDGGFAVAGFTESFGINSEFLMLKLDNAGNPEWAKTYGGACGEYVHSIVQTSDGGYIAAAYTSSFGAGYADFLVLKLNISGNLEWARTYGGPDYDSAYCIIQSSDGGYVVVGNTRSFGAGNWDILVIKLASNGAVTWARTFGGTGWDKAYSVTQTTDGGYAIAGWTLSYGAGSYDILVIKLDGNGALSWAKTLGGTSGDRAYCITRTSDGGVGVVGETSSFGGSWDFLAFKLGSTGDVSWARIFTGTKQEYGSITQTSDNGFAAAGWTASFGEGAKDFFFLRLDPTGDLAWARTFGGESDDVAYSLIQTSDGGYAVAGYTNSFGAGYADFLVMRLVPDGNYPDCVEECLPPIVIPSLTVSSAVVGADCSPSLSVPTPMIGLPIPTVTDACEPLLYIKEGKGTPGFQPRITCSPVPGGALFISPVDMPIRIYAANGRVAYSGQLRKGQNRIGLDSGVYLWTTSNEEPGTRNQKGKVVVR